MSLHTDYETPDSESLEAKIADKMILESVHPFMRFWIRFSAGFALFIFILSTLGWILTMGMYGIETDRQYLIVFIVASPFLYVALMYISILYKSATEGELIKCSILHKIIAFICAIGTIISSFFVHGNNIPDTIPMGVIILGIVIMTGCLIINIYTNYIAWSLFTNRAKIQANPPYPAIGIRLQPGIGAKIYLYCGITSSILGGLWALFSAS